MGGENHLIRAWHFVDQHPDQVGGFNGCGVAHSVGYVDGRRASFDRNLNNAAEVILLRSCRIHWRPLYVFAQVAGMGHSVMDPLRHLIHVKVRDRAVQG